MPSNKPFERTGHLRIQAPPPIGLCLPLKGSVRMTINLRRYMIIEPPEINSRYSMYDLMDFLLFSIADKLNPYCS